MHGLFVALTALRPQPPLVIKQIIKSRILADCWGADLTVVERELTLVGVNPALDQFTDLAAQLHADAREAARDAGKVLAAS